MVYKHSVSVIFGHELWASFKDGCDIESYEVIVADLDTWVVSSQASNTHRTIATCVWGKLVDFQYWPFAYQYYHRSLQTVKGNHSSYGSVIHAQ